MTAPTAAGEIAITQRAQWAIDTAREAGAMALDLFRDLDALEIESKGHQDSVSNADRAVEMLIRKRIEAAWPGDAILGEEYPMTSGTTGFCWVIDPIDGTANYVSGIPAWTVVIALTLNSQTVAGVVFEPNVGEMFFAQRGKGTTLNAKPVRASTSDSLSNGSVGVGIASRVPMLQAGRFISALSGEGGMYFRNASGALMLAYVAAGRLIGYAEPHMNAWDCIAGLLMVQEAGGKILDFDGAHMLTDGGRVIAGGSGVYDAIKALAGKTFDPLP